MKRKIVRLMLVGLTAAALTGCGLFSGHHSDGDDVIEVSDDEDNEDSDDDADDDKDDDDTSGEEQETASADGSYTLARTPQSDSIMYYDPSEDKLYQIDRKELAGEVSNPDPEIYRIYDEEEYYKSTLIGAGDGFLFFRDNVSPDSNGDSTSIVYAIGVEDKKIYDIWKNTGNGYLSGCEYYNGTLYIDYIIGYDENYKSLGDNVVGFRYDKKSDSFEEADLDEGLMTIINTANDKDAHIRRSGNFSNAHVYDECGYLPAYMDGGLVLINSSGTTLKVPGFEDAYDAYYDPFHIFTVLMNYETGVGKACVYDIRSGEVTEVSDERGANILLGKNGFKYYYSVSDSEEYGIGHNYIYEYDAETGKTRSLYDVKSEPGSSIAPGVEGFTLTETYIYYVGFEKGNIFWMPVVIEDPSSPCCKYELGYETLFDYGTIDYISTTINCPDCGTDLLDIYSEYLILDDSISEHTDQINEYLYQKATDFQDYESEGLDDLGYGSSCEDHEDHPAWYRITDDYYVSSVNEICGHYLTVDMTGYWYGGGAHGYPYRGQFLFDLDTGEAKTLSDFYTGTEDDFKRLIAEKTKEDFLSYDMDDYGSPYFAADADSAYEQALGYISLDSGNYEFTDDGIYYYYPPYDMGPYASGFIDIFVSYDELLGTNSL